MSTGDIAAMLAEFHAPLGQPFGAAGLGSAELRRKLHDEEHAELVEALEGGDLAAIAQELADVVYVAYGTAHSLGLPLDAVIGAIHAANMAKYGPDGPILRGDGKLMKPPGWRPADIGAVLAAHSCCVLHSAAWCALDACGPCCPACPTCATLTGSRGAR